MDVKIGGFVTFLGALALILKILDWYLTTAEKSSLHDHIAHSLKNGAMSAVAIVKSPLVVYTRILDLALDRALLSKTSLLRSASLAVTILLASASISGLLTNTFLGASTSPWLAYDDEISRFERLIAVNQKNEDQDELRPVHEETERYYESLEELVAHANKSVWKTVYIALLLSTSFLIATFATILSISFSRKVSRELIKTDSLLLIAGALLLGMVVSTIMFVLIVVILFTLTSGYLLFIPSFGSIITTQSSLIGAGVVIGYSFVAWMTSPVWIKAVAVGVVIPSMLLALVAFASCAIYPLRGVVGQAIYNLIERALNSEKGALAFFATGLVLLGAAITLAANIFVG